HDARQDVRIGVRRDAVAEVDDVPRRGAAAAHDVANVRLQHVPRRGEQRGVDVALHRDRGVTVGEETRRLVDRGAVVDADGDVPDPGRGDGVAHGGQEVTRAGAEVDDGHAEVGDVTERARARGCRAGRVVGE